MKHAILKALKKGFKEEKIQARDELILKLIEVPKDSFNGDYSFPFFIVSKQINENPHELAKRVLKNIGTPPREFEDIQVAGPYLNFFVNRKLGIVKLIKDVEAKKDSYGSVPSSKNQERVMIEFPSPNTNKPLHLGHLRNMSIGESVSRLHEFNGMKVFRTNLNNDRGIHICKSMAAYIKFATGDRPTKERKGDHVVGDFYVMFNEKSKKDVELEKDAHHLLQKFEEGHKATVQLLNTMNKWALDGFEETFKKFGIKFDKEYYESEIYNKGKDIVMKGLKEGIFTKGKADEIRVDLEKEGLGEKVLLRGDGTSLYITQDLYLANKKIQDFKLDKSIYLTGNEQIYHFDVLFKLLEKLKIADPKKLIHLYYGMVNLPDGRMKSREGTVVDADDLIQELQEHVREQMKDEKGLTKKKIEDRSLKIALAAIKYFLLKVDRKKDMIFNPKESISFEGDTGPYLQYSYARASSILRKASTKQKLIVPKELHEKEKALIKKLEEFKGLPQEAYREMNPTIIANYAYKLAQIFNEFYHTCPAIGSSQEGFRIHLVKTSRQILKNSLYLLGIETLEEM